MPNDEDGYRGSPSGLPRLGMTIWGILALAITMGLVALAWNSTGTATGIVQMRIFLVGWAVAAVMTVAVRLLSGTISRRDSRGFGSQTAMELSYHLVVGCVVGLAIGTTEWSNLHIVGWWQLWWTVPLVLGYLGNLAALRRRG